MDENEIGSAIVDCAYRVHKELGPGLLERVYELAMVSELESRGLRVECQRPLAVRYKGRKLEDGFRVDIVVEGKVIIELKSLEVVAAVHHKQLLTYLRLSGLKLGYLLNFGDYLMKDGITRYVNKLPNA